MKCRRSDGREEKEGSVGEAHQYPSNKVDSDTYFPQEIIWSLDMENPSL